MPKEVFTDQSQNPVYFEVREPRFSLFTSREKRDYLEKRLRHFNDAGFFMLQAMKYKQPSDFVFGFKNACLELFAGSGAMGSVLDEETAGEIINVGEFKRAFLNFCLEGAVVLPESLSKLDQIGTNFPKWVETLDTVLMMASISLPPTEPAIGLQAGELIKEKAIEKIGEILAPFAAMSEPELLALWGKEIGSFCQSRIAQRANVFGRKAPNPDSCLDSGIILPLLPDVIKISKISNFYLMVGIKYRTETKKTVAALPSAISLIVTENYGKIQEHFEGGEFWVCHVKNGKDIAVCVPKDQNEANLTKYQEVAKRMALAKRNAPPAVSSMIRGHSRYVYDFGQQTGLLEADWVEGKSLEIEIQESRFSGEKQKTCWVIEKALGIARLLEYLHNSCGLVLSDLKPQNIVNGVCIDWGTVANSRVGNCDQGTPEFAAPEQFDKQAKLMPQRDIYALGVLIYFMWSGRGQVLDAADVPIFKANLEQRFPGCRAMPAKLFEIFERCVEVAYDREKGSSKRITSSQAVRELEKTARETIPAELVFAM